MNIKTPTFSNVLIDIQSVIAVSPLGSLEDKSAPAAGPGHRRMAGSLPDIWQVADEGAQHVRTADRHAGPGARDDAAVPQHRERPGDGPR